MITPVELTLIIGIALSTVGSLIAIFRKHIKKSSCCFGSSIEFRPPSTEHNEPTIIITPQQPPATITFEQRSYNV